MKHVDTLAAVAIVAPWTAARAEDLSVDPSSWNFGAVALGASVARSFTLASIAASDASIYLVQTRPEDASALVCGEDVACDFAVTSSPALPVVLAPGEQTVVEVTFTPSALGVRHAFLYVRSNDAYPPPSAYGYLPLTGLGTELGAAAPAPAASPWALVAMALALGGAAAVALRRMAAR